MDCGIWIYQQSSSDHIATSIYSKRVLSLVFPQMSRFVAAVNSKESPCVKLFQQLERLFHNRADPVATLEVMKERQVGRCGEARQTARRNKQVALSLTLTPTELEYQKIPGEEMCSVAEQDVPVPTEARPRRGQVAWSRSSQLSTSS